MTSHVTRNHLNTLSIASSRLSFISSSQYGTAIWRLLLPLVSSTKYGICHRDEQIKNST